MPAFSCRTCRAARIEGLVDADEAAGQRPAAGMRKLVPLQQQRREPARAQPQQDEIDGEGRALVGGGIILRQELGFGFVTG